MPQVKAGKLRPLAVSTAKRSALTPEIPTMKEAGLPEIENMAWMAVMAPASTPNEIVERMNQEINAALVQPDVREKLAGQFMEPVGGSVEDLRKLHEAGADGDDADHQAQRRHRRIAHERSVAASDPAAGTALRCAVERRAASAEEIAAAWRRLDGAAGFYFGGDAGIAGTHPAVGLLVVEPSLALRVFADGIEVEARDALGEALLAHPPISSWRQAAARRPGGTAIAGLRAFLALFDDGHGSPADAILAGALRFEAHRLGSAAGPADASSLGVLFFASVTLQRDAAGAWQRVVLTFGDQDLARASAQVRLRDHTRSLAAPSPAAPAPRDDFPPGGYAEVVGRALAAMNDAGLVSLTLSRAFAAVSACLRRPRPSPVCAR
jgi:hypothetical protein